MERREDFRGGSAALILATDLPFFALVCGRYNKKRQAMARQRYVSERDNCRSIRSDAAARLRRYSELPHFQLRLLAGTQSHLSSFPVQSLDLR